MEAHLLREKEALNLVVFAIDHDAAKGPPKKKDKKKDRLLAVGEFRLHIFRLKKGKVQLRHSPSWRQLRGIVQTARHDTLDERHA